MKKTGAMALFAVFTAVAFFTAFPVSGDSDAPVVITVTIPNTNTASPAAHESPAATADLPTPASTIQSSVPQAAVTVLSPALSPTAQLTEQPAVQETPTPQPSAVYGQNINKDENEKVNKIEIKNDQSANNDGIVVLTPGEKAKGNEVAVAPEKKSGEEEEQAEGSASVDKSGVQEGGITLLTDAKEKMIKDHYILVERSGFISDNFIEDGVVYNLQDRETMQQGMYCFIKTAAGIIVKPGTEFLAYTDNKNVVDPVTGEEMGNLVIISGRGIVVEKTDAEGVWKVKIEKNYNILYNNSKIKLRKDFKDYYKKVTTAVKKAGQIQGFIIMRQNGFTNGIKVRDIVYIDRGTRDGLLPGDRVLIYRSTPNKDTGSDDAYNILGKGLVINVMKNNATTLITKSYAEMQVGDIVKTIIK
jgi:hypothetical protein